MKKSCPKRDSNPVSSACEATVLAIELRSLIHVFIERVKILKGFYLCYFYEYLPLACGSSSKMFRRELYFVNYLLPTNFLIGQTAKRYKYCMTKLHDKQFSYAL